MTSDAHTKPDSSLLHNTRTTDETNSNSISFPATDLFSPRRARHVLHSTLLNQRPNKHSLAKRALLVCRPDDPLAAQLQHIEQHVNYYSYSASALCLAPYVKHSWQPASCCQSNRHRHASPAAEMKRSHCDTFLKIFFLLWNYATQLTIHINKHIGFISDCRETTKSDFSWKSVITQEHRV